MSGGDTQKADLAFFQNLVKRQIRQDYLENITGFAWLVLQPLILLAVYAFVFSTIFKSRIPDSEVGFVPYLAVAFWPWTAFSESVLKATHTISGNAALIGKVAFATEQLPLSMVCSTFAMNMIGYVAVLAVLQLIGTDIQWLYVPLAIPVLALLCVLACSIAMFTSALQVFVKDTGQILPPLMTLWFFMTPILYSPAQLPAELAKIMSWNPMNWFVFHLRELILFGRINTGLSELYALLGVIVIAGLCLAFFRRFSGHFEDFL